ncbi:major facilitator family protein [Cyclospora cayetanensis]|uniref:Major facilitator family protein n=1 Tax=Cyclospora cayetanensis TaxID=88456 RepID=A0A1D3CRB8_9EIME|nr:major facilitator family protein [Cyclospora cayetanensis]
MLASCESLGVQAFGLGGSHRAPTVQTWSDLDRRKAVVEVSGTVAADKWFLCSRVMLTGLYFRVLNAISYAARSAAIFDAYLHMQFGGNKAIGAMASLTGLITVVVAPLAGWAADAMKARRCISLRCAAAWGLLCVCVNYLAIGFDSFNLLLASNLLWKAWYEWVTVLTESLFSDAIPRGASSLWSFSLCTALQLFAFFSASLCGLLCLEGVLGRPLLPPHDCFFRMLDVPSLRCLSIREGQRSRLFVLRRILTTLANGLGPLFSLCVFLLCGNAWRLHILHKLLVLLLWKEISAEEASRIRMDAKYGEPSSEASKEADDVQKRTESEGSIEVLLQQQDELAKTSTETKCTGALATPDCRFLFLRTKHVPWLMFISHCITFCGAGMTVKYFPLFFKTEYAFKPIHSCLLSTAYTISIAALTYVIQKVATHMGPTEASFLFTSIGVGGAFQNASTPIDRSVCLDLIPPRLVGRWAALQSLATLMWSVSALFGGLLADHTDYRQIFTFTGRIYIVAQLVYLPCLWLLPHQRRLPKHRPQLNNSKLPPLIKPELSPTTVG